MIRWRHGRPTGTADLPAQRAARKSRGTCSSSLRVARAKVKTGCQTGKSWAYIAPLLRMPFLPSGNAVQSPSQLHLGHPPATGQGLRHAAPRGQGARRSSRWSWTRRTAMKLSPAASNASCSSSQRVWGSAPMKTNRARASRTRRGAGTPTGTRRPGSGTCSSVPGLIVDMGRPVTVTAVRVTRGASAVLPGRPALGHAGQAQLYPRAHTARTCSSRPVPAPAPGGPAARRDCQVR